VKIRTALIWLAALVCGWVVSAAAAEWTLIVAPARYSVLQALFDVARRRPAVLLSYQGDAAEKEPALHAWNGEEWVGISLRDLAEVRFLTVMPSRVILVGDDKTLPAAIAEATAWCPRTLAIPSLDTPNLISEIGRILEFSREDWAWFAARYRLQLIDRNAPARSGSWYDRRENAPPPAEFPFFRRHRAVSPRSSAPPGLAPVVPAAPAIEAAPTAPAVFESAVLPAPPVQASDEPPAADATTPAPSPERPTETDKGIK